MRDWRAGWECCVARGGRTHGHCYLWKPEILWLHVLSDALQLIEQRLPVRAPRAA